jgi:hypothetical protein
VFQRSLLCDDFAWAKARATQIINTPPLRAFAHPSHCHSQSSQFEMVKQVSEEHCHAGLLGCAIEDQ